jgi:hypothetical protein
LAWVFSPQGHEKIARLTEEADMAKALSETVLEYDLWQIVIIHSSSAFLE